VIEWYSSRKSQPPQNCCRLIIWFIIVVYVYILLIYSLIIILKYLGFGFGVGVSYSITVRTNAEKTLNRIQYRSDLINEAEVAADSEIGCWNRNDWPPYCWVYKITLQIRWRAHFCESCGSLVKIQHGVEFEWQVALRWLMGYESAVDWMCRYDWYD
jgi:hypothetical protein